MAKPFVAKKPEVKAVEEPAVEAVKEAPKSTVKELSSALVLLCQRIHFPKLNPSNLHIYNKIVELDKAIKS